MQPINSDISYPIFVSIYDFQFLQVFFLYVLKNNPFSYMQSTRALKIQSMENLCLEGFYYYYFH